MPSGRSIPVGLDHGPSTPWSGLYDVLYVLYYIMYYISCFIVVPCVVASTHGHATERQRIPRTSRARVRLRPRNDHELANMSSVFSSRIIPQDRNMGRRELLTNSSKSPERPWQTRQTRQTPIHLCGQLRRPRRVVVEAAPAFGPVVAPSPW
jgi:hypothetical protein